MVAEPPDTSSLDALEALVISDGWGLVAQRIRETIELKRFSLEQSDVAAERTRGFIQGLRTVLNLPAILKTEYEAEMKK